jgi:hypothetical protein
MYDPKIGKWLSADPIGFEGEDANLYRYVGNRVVNGRDPTGLIDLWNVEDSPRMKLGSGELEITEFDINDVDDPTTTIYQEGFGGFYWGVWIQPEPKELKAMETAHGGTLIAKVRVRERDWKCGETDPGWQTDETSWYMTYWVYWPTFESIVPYQTNLRDGEHRADGTSQYLQLYNRTFRFGEYDCTKGRIWIDATFELFAKGHGGAGYIDSTTFHQQDGYTEEDITIQNGDDWPLGQVVDEVGFWFGEEGAPWTPQFADPKNRSPIGKSRAIGEIQWDLCVSGDPSIDGKAIYRRSGGSGWEEMTTSGGRDDDSNTVPGVHPTP